MNKFRIFLLFLITLSFYQNYFGQEASKAELFDDFGYEPCDVLLNRVDLLFNKLQDSPNSKGFVIIYGEIGNSLKALYFELIFKGQVEGRRFDKTRITIIRNQPQSKMRVQFWVAEDEKKFSNFEKDVAIFSLPKSKTKPFILFRKFPEGYCPSASHNELYAKVLTDNPKSRGNLVIYEKSRKSFYKTKRRFLKSLSKINSRRLRFFFVKNRHSNVEYWIIP